MRPLSTVELPGFQKMVTKLNPRYQLPSRNYFSRTAIPGLYSEVRQDIEQKLIQHNTFYSATTDMWTSGSTDPYISFTIHYINSNWDMCSHCLTTTYLAEDHTGENIKMSLLDTLSEWNLNATHLVAITTDSGANIKRACSLLGWTRISCFGHNLDLAIQKSLQDERVVRVLRICRQIVAKFSQSWKKSRDLAAAQRQKGLPCHKLKGDCQTRWGSSLQMIKRIAEQREAISVVLASDVKTSHLVLNWQDCDIIDSMTAALDSLGDLTDALSAEKHITISAVCPLMNRLTKEMLKEADEDTSLTAQMKRIIRVDLESRYQSLDLGIPLLDICSFLDPRFKDSDHFTLQDSIKDKIKEQMKEVLQVKNSAMIPDGEPGGQPEQSTGPPPTKKKSWLTKILGPAVEQTSTGIGITPFQTIVKEFDQYLHYPKVDLETNPLEWWKLHDKQFPLLSELARRYLCICATSVPSERVFSTGGNVVTAARSALKPHNVSKLIFLASNLQ